MKMIMKMQGQCSVSGKRLGDSPTKLNMRYLALTLLSSLMLLLIMPSYAQESEVELSPATTTQEEKEQTILSKASDEQIEEAAKFYDLCMKNDSMSNIRDCKCASSEFLDKRIELGDEATISDIMAANVDKCLKDGQDVEDIYGTKTKSDLPKITKAQLEEAQMVFDQCKSSLKISRFYDCECYAAKYLDARIEKGPLASKEGIIETFISDCRNIVETTGYEYTRCMAMTTKRPVKNIEPKDYCECYAGQWAKHFEAYQGLINFSSKNLMKERAIAYCRRNENYN